MNLEKILEDLRTIDYKHLINFKSFINIKMFLNKSLLIPSHYIHLNNANTLTLDTYHLFSL